MGERKATIFSDLYLLAHHGSCPMGDLNGKIGAAIPGIDLTHAGKKQTRDGGTDIRNVFGVIDKGNWLCIRCPV